MIPDVNVLVAAHHPTHQHHIAAMQWLMQLRSNNITSALNLVGQLTLSMPVISGFLRLVTNSKVFADPSSSAQAVNFIDWLLEDTNTRLIGQTTEWQHFRTLILSQKLHSNDIPDAWLASLALSLGEPFVTFDKGFRKLLPKSLLLLLK